jgi:hypothetical protein
MRTAVTAFVLFLSSTSLASFANAETIECGTGDVQCLIAAINQANADPNRTIIRLAGGTYLLTATDNDTDGPNALPSIVTRVTINGGEATLERASDSPAFRVFHVAPSGHLSLNQLTVRGGEPLGRGGALWNAGTVNILNSTFDGNGEGGVFNDHGTLSMIDSALVGTSSRFDAALFNEAGLVQITRTIFDRNLPDVAVIYTTGGDVRISQSTFTNNFAIHGTGGLRVLGGVASVIQTTFARNAGDGTGAISVRGTGTLTVLDSALIDNWGFAIGAMDVALGGVAYVTNTTFARNQAGGDCAVAAISNGGAITIVNSTIVDNKPDSISCRAFHLPAIIGSTSSTFLQNTIVHNTDPFARDCGGVITSLGNNLIGNLTDCTITLQLTDFTGEANLGALTDDGTPGNAHYPLLPESRAIDSANDAACPKKDQIGQPRQPRCDIGAVEFPPFGVAAP